MEIPIISPLELAEKLKLDADFILLDVREHWELEYARFEDQRLIILPLSLLAQQREAALPEAVQNRATEIVVLCHHGIRSADVTRWLLMQGWRDVKSLDGGIAAYAEEVDKSVGYY
jgi:rhodanese-related sulfurtransferase